MATRIRIEDQRTTLARGMEPDVVIGVRVRDLAEGMFRHDRPTAVEIEQAIDRVEDALPGGASLPWTLAALPSPLFRAAGNLIRSLAWPPGLPAAAGSILHASKSRALSMDESAALLGHFQLGRKELVQEILNDNPWIDFSAERPVLLASPRSTSPS